MPITKHIGLAISQETRGGGLAAAMRDDLKAKVAVPDAPQLSRDLNLSSAISTSTKRKMQRQPPQQQQAPPKKHVRNQGAQDGQKGDKQEAQKRKATEKLETSGGEKVSRILVHYAKPFDMGQFGGTGQSSGNQTLRQDQQGLDANLAALATSGTGGGGLSSSGTGGQGQIVVREPEADLNLEMVSFADREMPADVAARLQKRQQEELEKMREQARTLMPADIEWVQPINPETGLTAHQWLLSGWTVGMEIPSVRARIVSIRHFRILSNIPGVAMILTFDSQTTLELALHAWAPDTGRLKKLHEGQVVLFRKLAVQEHSAPVVVAPHDAKKPKPIIERGSFLFTVFFNRKSQAIPVPREPGAPLSPIVLDADDGEEGDDKEPEEEDELDDDDEEENSEAKSDRPMRAAKFVAIQRLRQAEEEARAVDREIRRDRDAARREAIRHQQMILWRLFQPGAEPEDHLLQPLDEADWRFFEGQGAEEGEWLRASGLTQRQIDRLLRNPLPAAKQQELLASVTTLAASSLPAGADPQCPVCFDKLKGERVVRMRCGHIMCFGCTQTEIKVRHHCPICRKAIDTHEPSSSSTS